MSSQTVKLPDIPVPGTSVILTNVEVTVEPLLPLDQIKMAIFDYIVLNNPPKEKTMNETGQSTVVADEHLPPPSDLTFKEALQKLGDAIAAVLALFPSTKD